MARPANPLKDKAILDIAFHLQEQGRQGLTDVRKRRYPTVPARTFRSWVKAAEKDPRVREPDPVKREMAWKFVERHRSAFRDPNTGQPFSAFLPSPREVIRLQDDARMALNLLDRWIETYRDAEMLRDEALPLDPATGIRGVANPQQAALSIRLRNDLITTAMSSMRRIWGMERMQVLYDTVVSEVAKAGPEVAANIHARLRELNEREGFTFEARL